ncbi:MAG: EamA family transporter, partial [Gammaproteobacteria bacterium]
LFNYTPGGESAAPGAQGFAWFFYALIILLAWGVQAYFMKLANGTMNAENIFLYMTIIGLLLIPIALRMTDFSVPIEYGWTGPGLAAITQILNAVGALTLVYAFRYGRAIVVAPLANAGAPLITAVVSMLVLGATPNTVTFAGIALAFIAATLLAIEPEEKISAVPA